MKNQHTIVTPRLPDQHGILKLCTKRFQGFISILINSYDVSDSSLNWGSEYVRRDLVCILRWQNSSSLVRFFSPTDRAWCGLIPGTPQTYNFPPQPGNETIPHSLRLLLWTHPYMPSETISALFSRNFICVPHLPKFMISVKWKYMSVNSA